jgi:hypothetical protein
MYNSRSIPEPIFSGIPELSSFICIRHAALFHPWPDAHSVYSLSVRFFSFSVDIPIRFKVLCDHRVGLDNSGLFWQFFPCKVLSSVSIINRYPYKVEFTVESEMLSLSFFPINLLCHSVVFESPPGFTIFGTTRGIVKCTGGSVPELNLLTLENVGWLYYRACGKTSKTLNMN